MSAMQFGARWARLLAAAALAACAANVHEAEREGSSSQPSWPAEAPEWVGQGSGAFGGEGGRVFYGVSAAAGVTNEALAQTTADNRARSELAKVVETYSASLMKDYLASTTAGDMSSAGEEQHVEQAVKTFAAQTLSGAEVVDRWVHPDGTVYTRVRLDLEGLKNNLDKSKELNTKVRDYVRKNAERVHMDLEKEEAKRTGPDAAYSETRKRPSTSASTPRQAFAPNLPSRLAAQSEELWVIAKAPAKDADLIPRDGPGSGELRAVDPQTQQTVPLPLKHTEVAADIAGYVASVKVTQKYENPYDGKIEAVYVFPLPHDAAVSDFLMVVGDRRIRGIIREREEAEQIYSEARRAGYVASLLTQERPNIFTQKVANIEPGHAIDIELVYYNALPYRDGAYVFAFPMVVGPRFNPPGHTSGVGAVPRGGQGKSGQPTEVQYLAPSERSGHDLSLTVNLEAGVRLESVTSSTHAIEVEKLSDSGRRVRLADKAVIPNQDFVLRYRVAGAAIKPAVLVHQDERGGYFTVMLQPPAELKRIPRMPREMIFVLDCSGSMSGVPLAKAKRAIRRALSLLDEDDSFQIINFSNHASQLGPRPLPATAANIKQGLAYLEALNSEGGTMMIHGIRAALDFPHEEGKLRLVSFLTDGYIGNESEILAAIHEKLGASRLFSFGVGSSVNRYLLEEMAHAGRGAVAYIELDDSASDEAVDAFYERVAYPALADIRLDFGRLQVSDVFPSRVPDLHVGRPVIVTGRYQGRFDGAVEVHGRAGGKLVRMSVEIPDGDEPPRPALAQVWARKKIADLADRALWSREDAGELAQSIKSTALSYNLMSAFTAFVAVDSSRRTEGDHGTTVNVPVPVPKGVRYDTTVSGE